MSSARSDRFSCCPAVPCCQRRVRSSGARATPRRCRRRTYRQEQVTVSSSQRSLTVRLYPIMRWRSLNPSSHDPNERHNGLFQCHSTVRNSPCPSVTKRCGQPTTAGGSPPAAPEVSTRWRSKTRATRRGGRRRVDSRPLASNIGGYSSFAVHTRRIPRAVIRGKNTRIRSKAANPRARIGILQPPLPHWLCIPAAPNSMPCMIRSTLSTTARSLELGADNASSTACSVDGSRGP